MALTKDPIPSSRRLMERRPPFRPVVMYQRWRELLFLHWSVPPEALAGHLPPGLRVDTFDGRAWVGVVPFFMRGVRPRFFVPVRGLSDFFELNLRTYVLDPLGRPGVWFFSLEASHRVPIRIARRCFHLNYQWAHFEGEAKAGAVEYRAVRHGDQAGNAEQHFRWSRSGAGGAVQPGSLEFFLVERYRLFAFDRRRGRLLTGRVSHPPYRVQRAQVSAFSKRLFTLNDLEEPEGEPDSVLASPGVDVRVHAPGPFACPVP